MATTIDELQVIITAQNKQFQAALRDVSKQLDGVSGEAQKASSKISTGFEKIEAVAVKALKWGVVGAIAAVTASVPAAVKRIDTLNNSARTFENMGFDAQKSAKSVEALEMSIRGLPTPLDSAMRGMTSLAATYGDIELGQKVFTSLNNAILGFGGSAAMVDNAIQQLSQLPMDGPLDAQTWNSLRNSGLTPVLVAMAKESKMSVSQMKEAFGEGELKVQDFIDRLIKMNKEGGGGLKSLEQIAKDSTKGISTGFANMRTAIARGVAAIIESIGSEDIARAISSIGSAFEGVLKSIGGVIDFVKANSEIFMPLAAGIAGVVTALTAWSVASKAVAVAQTALNVVLTANPIGVIIMAIAGLVAGLIYLWNTSEGFRNFFIGMWDAIVAAVQPVIDVFNTYLLPVLQMVWSFIINQFKKAWDDLKKAYEQIKQVLQPYIDQMKGPLMEVLKAVGIAIAVAVIAPLVLLAAAITVVVTVIATIISAIARFIGWIANLYAELVKLANLVIGTVANHFASAWNKITGVWSAATGFFGNIVNGIINFFASIPGRIQGFFVNAWNAVKNISWVQLGVDIISGILNGLNPGRIVARMKQIAASALDAVKSFLGIKSPSRVMRDEVGKMIGPGIADGIDASTKDAVKSATQSARSILGAYSGLSADIPTSNDLSAKLETTFSAKLSEVDNRKLQPVNVQIDGQTLLSFVIDGVNGKSFMTNQSVIDF